MTPFAALLLPVLTEGPMARVELQADREGRSVGFSADPGTVEAFAARLRADPRILDGGIRVDAGCASATCTVALDGLAAAMPDALDALRTALEAPIPGANWAAQRARRREWRMAWRSPSKVLAAAVNRVATGASPPLAERPPVRLWTEPATRLDARLSWGRLSAIGDVSPLGLAWDALVAQRQAAVRPSPERAVVATPSASTLLLVDAPGETRATIGWVWARNSGDTDRDTCIAGDFQSLLVQRLREQDGLTYDVSPLYSGTVAEGWGGAQVQVAVEAVPRALAAVREELLRVSGVDAAIRASVARRVDARYRELADSLAGRLALRSLPPAPPRPPPPYGPVELRGVVVLGSADTLQPLLAGEAIERVAACEVLYGGACP